MSLGNHNLKSLFDSLGFRRIGLRAKLTRRGKRFPCPSEIFWKITLKTNEKNLIFAISLSLLVCLTVRHFSDKILTQLFLLDHVAQCCRLCGRRPHSKPLSPGSIQNSELIFLLSRMVGLLRSTTLPRLW